MMLAIKGNKVLFWPVIVRTAGSAQLLDVDSLYTPYGLFLPLDAHAFNVLEYFETGKWLNAPKIIPGPVAAMVTADNKVIEFLVSPEGVAYRTFPLGKNTVYVRAEHYDTEITLRTACQLSSDFKDIPNVVAKVCSVSPSWFAFTRLSDIQRKLKARGYTKPVPRHPFTRQCFGVTVLKDEADAS